MAKLRGKPIPTTISRIRRKKMKIEDPTTTKDGVKPGTSKGSKTGPFWRPRREGAIAR